MTANQSYQLQSQQGVRAEPKFLRDPTALESLTSAISGFSSYVVANLPKKASLSSLLSGVEISPNAATAFPYPHPHHQLPLPVPSQNYNPYVGNFFPGDVTGPVNDDLIKAAARAAAVDREREVHNDAVTFAAFDWLEIKKGGTNTAGSGASRRRCLLLGYPDGFQIWDVTDLDDVREICSVRDEDRIGAVACLQIVPPPRRAAVGGKLGLAHDEWEDQRPLVAIVSTPKPISPVPSSPVTPSDLLASPHLASTTSSLVQKPMVQLYSLRTHTLVKVLEGLDDDDVDVLSVKCNERVIAVSATHATQTTLHIYSTLSLSPFGSPLTDVYHEAGVAPVFVLGARFLAYATSTPVTQAEQPAGAVGVISGASLGVLSGEKDVKDAAKEVALEVVNGVRTLGNYSYQTLTSYFSGTANAASTAPPGPMVLPPPHIVSPPASYPNQSSPRHNTTLSSSPASPYSRSNYDGGFTAATNGNGVVANAAVAGGQGTKKGVPSGMVMIRDIAPTTPTTTRDSLPPVIAHFRPHNHSISLLSFNPAGTLLMTVSSQAHTFQVFSVGSPRSGDTRGVPGTGVSHLYKLSRGYTDAQVEDCRFSSDSQWCAVSTARGTTHIYAINPEGGPAEIVGHVRGRARNSVGNLGAETQVFSQNAVVRIKQRTPMPTDATTPGAAATNNPDINSITPQPPSIMASPILGSPSSQTMQYGMHGAAFSPIQSPSQPYNELTSSTTKPLRAKLATAFLEPSRTPYLFHTGHGRSLVPASASVNGAAGTAKPPVAKAKKSPLSGATASSSVTTPAPPFNQMRRLSPTFTSLLSTTVSAASGVHQRARTWAFSGSDRGAGDRVFGFDEETGDDPAVEEGSQKKNGESAAEEIGYQDLLSFHPGGTLTLHRCWVGIGATKRREGSRVIETKELIVWEEDVAEWKVVRRAEWEEVKISMEALKKDSEFSKPFHAGIKLRRSNSASSFNSSISNGTSLNGATGTHGSHLWLANAEIATYVANDAPLWQSPQFSFQTYSESYQDAVREGRLPATKRVIIRKEVPEPYGTRAGRVAGKGRGTLGGSGEGEDGEEVEDDAEGALAELQEDISKAMRTQLDSGNNSLAPGRSPGVPKRLSSSAGATTGGLTMTKPMMNRVPSHSFEDAYLVNMGGGLTVTSTNVSGYSPPPSLHPAISPRIRADNENLLIQFDDTGAASFIGGTAGPGDAGIIGLGLGEDINVFSPDGDNEVEFPSDSVFVGEQFGWNESRM